MKKIISFLIFLVLVQIIICPVQAQSNKLDSITAGFEESGKNWHIDSAGFISIVDSMYASGSSSMAYARTIADSGVIQAISSIDTRHTVMHVRTATLNNESCLVAAAYDGSIIGLTLTGTLLWEHPLSGFMVHDIWCSDLNGDGNDETLVANADGSAYCVDSKGRLLWSFQANEAPMYAITVVHKNKIPYVVCGGFDLAIYYLNPGGKLLKKIHSSTYSKETTWDIDPKYNGLHYANFLRPLKRANGTEVLMVHGNNNHMQRAGGVYLFNVMEDKHFKHVGVPYALFADPKKEKEIAKTRGIGAINICDTDGDGNEELLLGNSQHYNSTLYLHMDVFNDKSDIQMARTTGFGYLIAHPHLINDNGIKKLFILHGNQLHLVPLDSLEGDVEKLTTNYAFNGTWQEGQLIYLASVQSGGSCIYILDLDNPDWKENFIEFNPKGKMQQIFAGTDSVRTYIESYTKPAYVRDPLPVYFLEGKPTDGLRKLIADKIRANYSSPIFLEGSNTSMAEDWDRSHIPYTRYQKRNDGRRSYTYTQDEVVNHFASLYPGDPGIGVWGGHGNDPYYFQLSTHKKIMDTANGKKTVLIFPELEDHSDAFVWVMNDLFYPMADYAQGKNTNLYIRTKANFWFGSAYMPAWQKLMDGKYPEVFVPSMEETTNKAVDLSVPARAGVWASGAVNYWGHRCVPDNQSFDRARQFGYQRVPNHFLRHTIYMLANGATYINNLVPGGDYYAVLWDLIAKGALYIPKRDEILSYSPVHLSIFNPDMHFIEEGARLKWQIYYEDSKNDDPYVFSRQNGTWGGAQVTDWDYSRYANGVKDRRHNFMPPTPNGMVLMTPPQSGVLLSPTSVRGNMNDSLHPIYKGQMVEYITDGHYYYSADTTQKYDADEYYSVIEQKIEEKASILPLTVKGDVAWVVAQLDPTHIRLTLVDNGYLNPESQDAVVSFHSVTPIKMTDILDGTTYDLTDKESVEVNIPLGLFRFIDIELDKALN